MEIRLLGPVEASVDGRPVPLGAGKPRALLALLALRAGSTVPVARLIDGLWGERPPATATKLVQLHVSALRKALVAAGDGSHVVTRGHGYELRVAPDDVDAARFERLLACGRPREALALWHGPPLHDVAGEPFAAAEIRKLEELRLAALELALEQDLDAGRHAEVVGELEALARQEPLRERLHALRMLALYRCGRQADALAAYREARSVLVAEVGAEPGPELRRLHEAVLRQDDALEPPAAEPAGLPPQLDVDGPLVGRDGELAWLRDHWRAAQAGEGRVVLVTGPRGIGRTHLAAALAAAVHRGGAVVRYVPADAPADVPAPGRPALVVLDDVDRRAAGPPAPAPPPAVLVVATAEDDRVARALGAAGTLALAPLGPDAVEAIARLHLPGHDDVAVPVDRLVAASRGVPRDVHRAAADWARAETARRVGAAAERVATDRSLLRTAEAQLAGDVVALQAAHEHPGPDDGPDEVVLCPFKGLAAFGMEDAGVFFGRERLVAEMVARLAGAPLMGIVGPSGSGKSSVLHAGLLAALAAGVLPGSASWPIVVLRPGAHPRRALDDALAGHAAAGRLVLAVDQFEELFTACADEAERAAFAAALVAAARAPGRPALVLVAIRADFYGRCAAYPELARLLGAAHVLVGPMRRDELRSAIERPARRAGLQVDAELADALVDDVRGEPGALPLLATALLELWRRRDGRRLRLEAYERTGGVHRAVARLAEGAYARLGPAQRDVARTLLLRLVGQDDGGTVVRQRVPLAELGRDRDAGVAEVLEVLADDRLVTIDRGEVEVAHEALLREWPRLRGWLEEDEHGRRLHRHLRAAAREWDGAGRDPGELYRGARLAAALEWSAAHPGELGATERAFLAESRAASGRSHRRLRAVLAGVVGLLVLAVAAGVVALEQRGAARAEAIAADAQRLGARALVEDDLDRSLLLARQGVALDDTPQTRGNLLAALVRSPAAIGVLRGDGERMWALALSPDGRTLAAGDPAGSVFLFDTRTRRRVAAFEPVPGNAWIVQLAFRPDGRRLAIAHDTPRGNVVTVIDSATRRPVARMVPPRERFVSALRWSPDGARLDLTTVAWDPAAAPALLVRFDARTGRRLLAPVPVADRGASPLLVADGGERLLTVAGGAVTVRDAETLGALRTVRAGPGTPAEPEAYALGPDGRALAIGTEDGEVRLVDLVTGDVRPAPGRHEGPVTAAAFTPDGRALVTAGEDGEVIVRDPADDLPGETLAGHANGIAALAVADDGRTLYTAGLDGVVLVWDLEGARRLGRPFAAGAGNQDRPQLALSADGELIAMGQDDGSVSLVDAERLVRRPAVPVVDTGQVLGMGFVPRSRLLVVGGPEGFLALVDVDGRRVVRRLRGHTGRIYTPGISADGRLLATGSDDDTVRLWSLPDGRPAGPPLRFARAVWDAQLSPDGRSLTVVLVDDDFESGAVEVWDTRTRRRTRTVPVGDFAGFARFSPDGRRIAVGFRSGRTAVWSTASWAPAARDLVGDASGIVNASFTPDGRTLATASDTGTVRLWDVPSGQPLGAPLPGVPSRPAAAYFTQSGTRLVASYDTGRAYLWDVRPAALAAHACAVAGRRLTRREWADALPRLEYAPAC